MICRRKFEGLFLDGELFNVKAFNNFNKKFLKSNTIAVQEWLDKENINSIIEKYINTSSIDLLSIDIDGYDYWLWDAITCIKPRVVIMEYNATFGKQSITLPYIKNFIVSDYAHEPKHSYWYHGASLKALYKLGLEKDYFLVGTDKNGVNCFFIRKDVAEKNKFELKNPDQIFKTHKTRTEGTYTGTPMTQVDQFDKIKHLEFVEI